MELERTADALAEEQAPADPQAEAVRAVLEQPFRPYLNRAFFWANILVFAAGLYAAWRQKAAGDFLMPIQLRGGGLALARNPAVDRILDQSGSLSREDIRAGRYWRLITCAFVHIGLIHLAMNLFALRAVGADVELMFGRWRYLVIYLLAALGGSCYGLTSALPAQKLAGASGAICGLMAAAAVWLLLNRRYLPRKMVVRALIGVVLSAVLIGFISMASVVSGRAHTGGAVAGGVAALLLHYLRFGNDIVRAVALVLLVAVPFACLAVLESPALRKQPQPANTEQARTAALLGLRDTLDDVRIQARTYYNGDLGTLLETRPERRDEADIGRAQARLRELEKEFSSLLAELEKVGRLSTEVYEAERQATLAFVRLHRQLAQEAQQALRQGEMLKKLDPRFRDVSTAQTRWRAAVQQSNRPQRQ